jgi:hypothetical protein
MEKNRKINESKNKNVTTVNRVRMKYLDWADIYQTMNRWREVLVKAVDKMEE